MGHGTDSLCLMAFEDFDLFPLHKLGTQVERDTTPNHGCRKVLTKDLFTKVWGAFRETLGDSAEPWSWQLWGVMMPFILRSRRRNCYQSPERSPNRYCGLPQEETTNPQHPCGDDPSTKDLTSLSCLLISCWFLLLAKYKQRPENKEAL